MTALTHRITRRTAVATAIMLAAAAGLVVALTLGISAATGHSPGGQGGGPPPAGQLIRGTVFHLPGCLVCYFAR